ncbi:hypothetical protein BH10PSE10_BH10PSE10_04050 [soil metagenome]
MTCRNLVLFLTVVIGTTVAVTGVRAEVEKFMLLDNGQMRPSFLLKSMPPKGWVQDMDATKKNAVLMYVLKGKDFASSPALMYVRMSFNSETGFRNRSWPDKL